MWDAKPWDNDTAADWFGKLMDDTALPEKVRNTLQLANAEEPDEENTPVLRAAAYVLLRFGFVYVWPINNLQDDLKRAIRALELVLADEEYCYNETVTAQVTSERNELQERLAKICP